MIFEFTASPNFDFITDFSEQFKLLVDDNYLGFPKEKGEGYIRKVTFDSDFTLLMHRYKLNESFTIIRNPSKVPNDLISIFFYNCEQPEDLVYKKENPVRFVRNNESAIQVTTSNLNSIIRFPARSETYYIDVSITAKRLHTLLNNTSPSGIIDTTTSGTASFLYFESMTAETQRLLKYISSINVKEPLSRFYIQIKVQELLFHLFNALLKRKETSHTKINNADAQQLMNLRNIILSDLSVPPVLPDLADRLGMSETKMKQLFKQTFGDTIYDYYQKVRMEKAAFLLTQDGYSVSEAGYALGFTNLSHFIRVFERHYSVTPKKFSYAR